MICNLVSWSTVCGEGRLLISTACFDLSQAFKFGVGISSWVFCSRLFKNSCFCFIIIIINSKCTCSWATVWCFNAWCYVHHPKQGNQHWLPWCHFVVGGLGLLSSLSSWNINKAVVNCSLTMLWNTGTFSFNLWFSADYANSLCSSSTPPSLK